MPPSDPGPLGGPTAADLDGHARAAWSRRRLAWRIRVGVVSVALASASLTLLRDPGFVRLVALFALALLSVAAVAALAMGLAGLGFALFAAADRAFGRLRRACTWPEPEDDRPR